MESTVTRAIVTRYFEKLQQHLSIDVAIVGAGPSGLVAGHDLAAAGLKVAIFERKLAPGGGIWGGGMLFNEIVVQEDALSIVTDFDIRSEPAGEGFFTIDAVEAAAALILGARRAGAVVFNAVSVEDIVFREGRVAGVVILWAPVQQLGMHVDPLMVTSRAVLDGTGHQSEIAQLVARKAGVKLETATGAVMGERPMWIESGEATTVENTKCLYPGFYASGMAANNISGGFRMGPIFGGMFKSGRKVARLILEGLDG
jgi:thiamine thiazole synthase